MIRINQLKLPVQDDESNLEKLIRKALRLIAMKILHIISSNDRLMPDTEITYYIYTVLMLNLRIPMNLP